MVWTSSFADRMSKLRQDGARQRAGRENLFSKRRKASASTASEAQSIQKSLMRTQDLLKSELQRVSHLGNAIEEDGNMLQQTMDQHKSLNTKTAQKALTALERAQREEQRMLMMSVCFFFLVSFYVMWSRVLIKFDVLAILWSWF